MRRASMHLQALSHIFVGFLINPIAGLPDLSNTPFHPVVLEAGDNLLIECVVRNRGEYSVLWKRTVKRNVTELLTADISRVTEDSRVSVIHNAGNEEWLLNIKSVNLSDSGVYACETNAVPSVSSFRNVIVTSHLPSVLAGQTKDSAVNSNHTYKDCCKKKGVRRGCLKFCSFESLLSEHYDPTACLEFLPTFGECMSDGRDHTPCCREQNLPRLCSELCRGQYKITTMVEHYSCNPYTASLLACISRGIELLPSQPENVIMEAVSPSSINISWTPPKNRPQGISHYIISVKRLNSFDGNEKSITTVTSSQEPDGSKFITDEQSSWRIQVNNDQTYWLLDSLDPFTMYEVTVKAENEYGSSQESNPIRGLTMIATSPHSTVVKAEAPSVPDIRSCCIRNGLDKDLNCVKKLCDPEKSDLAKTEDFIICAPFVKTTFNCLGNGVDHTSCCLQRGLPEVCLPLCSGNVIKINYTHFICVNYMPALTNCVLQSYGVLPSAPRDLSVTVHPKWVLIQWNPPEKLAGTVKSYHLYYKKFMGGESQRKYTAIEKATSPYLLESLEPNTVYEIYVSPVNKYGIGEGSPRLVVTTAEIIPVDVIPRQNKSSELASCCQRAGISDECLPMCDYRAPFSTLLKLGPKCEKFSHVIVRCSAGGRDHTFCCARRNIPSKCVSLCAGYSGHLPDGKTHQCYPSLPQMVECMEQGLRTLPGVPRELYSDGIKSNALSLKWSPPLEPGTVTSHYEVYVRAEDFVNKKMEPYRLAANVTKTEVTLKDLIPGNAYGIYVVAGNKYGTSLPSYVLNVRTPISDAPPTTGIIAKGRPGPLSGFEVKKLRLHEIELFWRPTVHIHPDDRVAYMILYSMTKGDEKTIDSKNALNLTTEYHTLTLKNLTEDTAYYIWGYTIVTSNSTFLKSLKSDILLVRTDRPIPAVVDGVHLIPPIKYHLEGSDITAMCAATGRPEPLLSFFLDGTKLKESRRMRMTAKIFNVSRHMKEVICRAENGFGPGGVKVVPVNVVYPPSITTPVKNVEVDNSLNVVIVECHVTANPQPHTVWYRDETNGKVVISSPRHLVSITTKYHEYDYPSYIMSLKIAEFTPKDYGTYHCHAENQHGTSTSSITLIEKNVVWNTKMNVTDCCKAENVSAECIDACAFDIDIQRALNKPECIPELEKMMRCASDGSDHRRCCLGKGVDRSCTNWCRGYRVPDAPLCILGYAKQIIDCFEEGNAIIPGPPKHLKFDLMQNKTVQLTWDAPKKNTDFVELYRLFWKVKGNKYMGYQVPVNGKEKKITNLDPGSVYQFSVRAYNHYGKSMPSNMVEVSVPGKLTATSLASQSNSKTGVALTCITILFVILILCIAAFFIRKKFFVAKGVQTTGGIAFENPSYLKDSTSGNESSRTGISMSSLKNGLKSQPNVYEELKVPT